MGLLNVDKIKGMLSNHFKLELQLKVANGEESSYPIEKSIYIIESFKVFRVFFILSSSSFFLGIFWHIFVYDFQTTNFVLQNGELLTTSQNFRTDYSFDKDRWDSDMRACIKMMYFALTTLTTIGFGDYHPVSIKEKVMILPIMLLGVSVFTSIIGQLIDVIRYFIEITQKGNHKDLTKWVSLLARFNGGNPLGKELISSIENFFDYYWEYNRLEALKTDMDLLFLDQLPHYVQN